MADIQLDEVSKTFGSDVIAVDDVTLHIADGEFMVLVGPSGCGKSTLLRMVAGLETVTTGSIRMAGCDITRLPVKERDIAMVFQNYALYPHMTVRDNLAFGLRMRRTPKADIAQHVAEVARVLGLEELLSRRPSELSGGQRQRVAMGRAMVRQPAAFLMDEPLSNLDAKLRVDMRAELARLHERLGVTTIYVTHDQVEAMTLGTRVAVLRDGVLQQCDRPQVLFDQPTNLFVAAFIGSPSMNLTVARIACDTVEFANVRAPLVERPGLPDGSDVILGIRPTDFSLARDPETAQLSARVEVVEELGAETLIVFPLDVPPVLTDDVRAASDGHRDARILMDDRAARFTARLVGRHRIQPGQVVDLSIESQHLHFFSPETGEALAQRVVTPTASA